MSLLFINGYENDKKLRAAFNGLAGTVFGFSLEDWFQRGLWSSDYSCYSYYDEQKGVMAANISASRMRICCTDKTGIPRVINAVQLGTVMTHPDYRGRGLSAALMGRVFKANEETALFYLFANNTVLDFYPKFGFKKRTEYICGFNEASSNCGSVQKMRRIDMSDQADYNLIKGLAFNRSPISQSLGVINPEILMFNCLYTFCEHIYYIEVLKTVVIFKTDRESVDIYDIISESNVDIKTIIGAIGIDGCNMMRLHFLPDHAETYIHIPVEKPDTVLFMRCPAQMSAMLPEYPIFPETSHA